MILSIQNLTFPEPARVFWILGWSLSALCQESWEGRGLFLGDRGVERAGARDTKERCLGNTGHLPVAGSEADPIRATSPEYRDSETHEQGLCLAPSRLWLSW